MAKPTKSYIRLGLRSHGKGTFHEKVEDPSKVAMDKLYLVKENDFIINITFAWEQALAIAEKPDENKLVSHRFPTFIFNENYGIEFFKHYFLGKRFKYLLNVSSPGGAGRNKVLNISQFKNIELKVPCYKEQLKIGSFITLLTENIKKQTIKIENLRKRKSNFLERSFI
ncbi:restriction endonuclease subunit S [Macrococcoides caseolyticum]|uniref:restriction endonuclease subunit S n=1 Tax=Macrococcoides caseolyticum TaxID=69966 RepID=UPI0039C99159